MSPSHRKPVIGLIGGVGSGKSTAAAELGRLGCLVVDGDRIGQELLGQEDVRRELRRQWGAAVFDSSGRVDRKALADRVFKHPEELSVLNKVMQPRIGRRIEELIDQARKDATIPAIVIDAAIMLEAGWDRFCTHLVFVHASADQRAGRVGQRGWDRSTWQAREKSQISLDIKRQRCYLTLDNSLGAAYLAEQISELFNRVVHETDRP